MFNCDCDWYVVCGAFELLWGDVAALHGPHIEIGRQRNRKSPAIGKWFGFVMKLVSYKRSFRKFATQDAKYTLHEVELAKSVGFHFQLSREKK